MLLSFERPALPAARGGPSGPGSVPAPPTLFADLENCTVANEIGYHRVKPSGFSQDHRQDSKGTRWMPWHQESKKDVNGCDKPRLGAE
jgi:hypothetical protein